MYTVTHLHFSCRLRLLHAWPSCVIFPHCLRRQLKSNRTWKRGQLILSDKTSFCSRLGSSFYCVHEHWWGADSLARNLIRTRLKICAMRPSRARAQCGRGLRSRKLHTTTGEPRLNIKTTSCDQNVPFVKNTLTHTNTKLRTHTFAKTQPYMHVCSSCMFWKLNVELLQSLTRSVSQLGNLTTFYFPMSLF